MHYLSVAAIPLGLINLLTIAEFWRDKSRARNGGWRVPEVNLLALAALGGTPGAFLARHLLRHKTRKEPFSTRLQLIAVLQIGGGAGFLLL